MRMVAWAFFCAFAASSLYACGDDKKVINRCTAGEEGCECIEKTRCNAGLACASEHCVKYAVGGSSGSGPMDGSSGDGGKGGAGATVGEGGASGDSGASGEGGVTGAGGVTGQGGNLGDAGEGGVSGSAGSAGDGGSAGSAGAQGSAGSGGAADTCSGAPANTIDNFATCNDRICEIAGRSGAWYSFADTGVNLNFAVSVPGTGWVDRTCAAWAIGGPLTTGSKTFAGIGLELAAGAAYDLSAHSGVTIALETDARVWFVVKTANGGYFGGFLAATVGTETRSLAFAAMTPMAGSLVSVLDKSQVTEFQVTAEFPASGFGWAVHRVTLY